MPNNIDTRSVPPYIKMVIKRAKCIFPRVKSVVKPRKYANHFVCFVCFCAVTVSFMAQTKRTLWPDDLMSIDEIGEVAISPDGQTIAFVRRRPRLSAHEYGYLYLFGNDRADIW